MIEHVELYKELLNPYFVEFIELFFPRIAIEINPKAIEFLHHDQESDAEQQDKPIVVKAELRNRETCFWISIESQDSPVLAFNRRIFHRYAQLDATYNLPIFPIILFPVAPLQVLEANCYRVEFADRNVLNFNFATLQMFQLNWRDFLQRRNPVAAALMSTMNIKTSDRPLVKAECLKLLLSLKLDTPRRNMIARFIDTHLQLSDPEEEVFKREIERIGLSELEKLVAPMSAAKRQFLNEGAQQEAQSLVLRQLNRRLGGLSPELEEQILQLPFTQIEDLGEALLDFKDERDLTSWLDQPASKPKGNSDENLNGSGTGNLTERSYT